MAVGSDTLPVMHPVAGFKLGVAECGIKKAGRKDLVVMALHPETAIAGVFTKNAFCAAPVQVAKTHLATGVPRYLVTNTGNANAGTGEQGLSDANRVCQALASLQSVEPDQVLPFSTGVIGENLPVEKILAGLPAACDSLTENGWEDAANGILTTDTRPKGASVKVSLRGTEITITGIAKGAGMIKPNMATMLGYVATDLAVAPELLQSWLVEVVDKSFNRITVDGDTSTNDSVILAATGQSQVSASELNDDELENFKAALLSVFVELAQSIVRDGEGATKFVSVLVEGGLNRDECLAVAYTVAESPLVKTALFASDPNWGRILAAVGRAGISDLDVDNIQILLDDVLIVEAGGRSPDYREEAGQMVMDQSEFTVRICLNRGGVSETVWTTDLSYEYVTINAEYRT